MTFEGKKKRVKGFYLHPQDEQRLDDIHRSLMRNEIDAHMSLIVAASILALRTIGAQSAEYFVKMIEAERSREADRREPIKMSTKEMSVRIHARFKEKGLLNMEPGKERFDAMTKALQEVVQEWVDKQEKKGRVK